MRVGEQEVDLEISGRETLKDGQIIAWRSATPRQETEYVGDTLQPTFESQTSHHGLSSTLTSTVQDESMRLGIRKII